MTTKPSNFAYTARSQNARVLEQHAPELQNAMAQRANAMVCQLIMHRDPAPLFETVVGPSQMVSHRDDQGDGFRLANGDWIHLMPVGQEISLQLQFADGTSREITQVFDTESLQSVASNFRSGTELLLNYEHFASQRDKESRAAGWIDSVQNREDGLWGHIRWTPKGKADVLSGEYRFVSPEFDFRDGEEIAPGRYRFSRLKGAGLTNVPRLKGMLQPISHREAPATQPKINMNEKLLNKLRSFLGLAEDADEAAIEAAIPEVPLKATVDELADVEHRNKELTNELVEHDLARFSSVIEDSKKETFRAALVNHRDSTIALLESIKVEAKPTPPTGVYHRESATPPNTQKKLAAEAAAQEQHAAKVSARAEVLHRESGNKKPLSLCWREAEAELAPNNG